MITAVILVYHQPQQMVQLEGTTVQQMLHIGMASVVFLA
jgi:hypothetical protein